MINDKVTNRINNIIAYYSAKAYIYANYKNGVRKGKKYHPYYISSNGLEALDALRKKDKVAIKSIILKFMFTHKDIDLNINCYNNNNYFCRYHLQKQYSK